MWAVGGTAIDLGDCSRCIFMQSVLILLIITSLFHSPYSGMVFRDRGRGPKGSLLSPVLSLTIDPLN